MTWAAVAMAGAAVIGAGVQAYGAGQAADAQKKGIKKANAIDIESRNMGYAVLEPNRMLGYQAGADLSNLYGWATPGYTSYSDLVNGSAYGGGGGTVNGSPTQDPNVFMNINDPLGLVGGSGGVRGIVDPLGLTGGGKQERYGATIDQATGTVDVAKGHSSQDEKLTHYLRTGEWTLTGKKSNDIKAAIDKLRASGWTFDPVTGKGSTAGQRATAANGLGAKPAGDPSMSRFFTSPDYQFRLAESLKANDQGAAARGGVLSGNAIRANTALAGNLASGEMQNYINNLFRSMGYGQTATGSVVNVGQTSGQNQMYNALAMGDARASGVANQYGAIAGGIQGIGSAFGGYRGGMGGGSINPSNFNSAGYQQVNSMTNPYLDPNSIYPGF